MNHLDEASYFEVRVLNAKTGELVWSHLGRRGFMDQLAFSPDGNTLAMPHTVKSGYGMPERAT